MNIIIRITVIAVCLLIMQKSMSAQVSDPEELKMSDEIQRFHAALRRSPKSEPIFEKFYSHWLTDHNDDAMEKFLTANLESRNIADYQILALYQARLGNELEAIRVLTDALKIEAENAQIHFDLAKLHMQNLDFKVALKSIKLAESLSKEDDLSFKIAKSKGVILVREGKQKEAVLHWQKLMKDNKKDNELVEDLIELLLAEGLNKQATKLNKELIESTKDPYRKALYTMNLARIYNETDKSELAIEIYEKNLEISGQGSWLEREIISRIKEVYLHNKDQDALLGFYQKSIKKYPNRILLKKEYADTLAVIDRIDEAEKLYRDIIKLTPGDNTQIENLITMLSIAQRNLKVKTLLEGLIKDEPQNTNYLLQLADVQYILNDKNGLRASLSKRYEIGLKDESAQLNYIVLLKKYELQEEVKKQLVQCSERFPKSVKVKLTLMKQAVETKDSKLVRKIGTEAASLANKEQLLKISDLLSEVDLDKEAFQILKNNFEKYKKNIGFIQRLCKVAIDQKLAIEAIPWATSLLYLAKSDTEIESILEIVLKVIIESNQEVKMIKKYAKKSQQNVPELCLLAILYYNNEQSYSAEKILKQLVASKDLSALIQVARIYEQRNQILDAINVLNKALKLPKGKKVIYLMKLVSLHQKEKNYDQALEIVKIWKILSPNNKIAWARQVDLLMILEKFQEALKQLHRMKIKFSNEPSIFDQLVRCYRDMGKNKEMRTSLWSQYLYEKSIARQQIILNKIVKVHKNQDELDELSDKLKKRYKVTPKSLPLILALVDVCELQFNTVGMKSYLVKALKLASNDVFIYHRLATMQEREGNLDEVKKYLVKAVAIDKTNKSVKRLAEFYFNNESTEKAVKLLKNIGYKNNTYISTGISDILIANQEYEKAHRFLEKDHLKFPNNWSILYQLVYLSHALKKYDLLTQYTRKMMLLNKGATPTPTPKAVNNSRKMLPIFSPNLHIALFNTSKILKSLKKPEGCQYALEYHAARKKIMASLASLRRHYPIHERDNNKIVSIKPSNLVEAKAYALSHLISLNRAGNNEVSENWIKIERHVKQLKHVNSLILLLEQSNAVSLEKLLTDQANKISIYWILAEQITRKLTDKQYNEALKILEPQNAIQAFKLRIKRINSLSLNEQISLIRDIDNSSLSIRNKLFVLYLLKKSPLEIKTEILKCYYKYFKFSVFIVRGSQHWQTVRISQQWSFLLHLEGMESEVRKGLIQNKKYNELIKLINLRCKNFKEQEFRLRIIDPTGLKKHNTIHFLDLYGKYIYQTMSELFKIKKGAIDTRVTKKMKSYKKHLYPLLNKVDFIPLRIHLSYLLGDKKKAIDLLKAELAKNPQEFDLLMLSIHYLNNQKVLNRLLLQEKLELASVNFNNIKNLPLRVKNYNQMVIDSNLLRNLYCILKEPKQYKNFKITKFHKNILNRFVGYNYANRNMINMKIDTMYQLFGMHKEYLALQVQHASRINKNTINKNTINKKKLKIIVRKKLTNLERLQRYLSKGKRSVAARFLADSIRKEYLSYKYLNTKKNQNIFRLIKSFKLTNDVIIAFEPKMRGNYKKWIFYFKIIQKLDAYEKLKMVRMHLANFKYIALRYRLEVAMMIMPDYQDKAIEMLQSIPLGHHVYVAKEFLTICKKHRFTNLDYINHLKGYNRYLKECVMKTEKEVKKHNEKSIIVGSMMKDLFAILYYLVEEKYNIGKSYAFIDVDIKENTSTAIALQRDRVLEKIIKQYHSYPASTDLALRVMLLRDRDLKDEKSLELISKSLELYDTTTVVSKFMPSANNVGKNWRNSKTTTLIGMPSAHQLAIEYIVKKPKLAAKYITSELLDRLKVERPKECELIEMIRTLSMKNDEAFPEIAKMHFKSSSNSSNEYALYYFPQAKKYLSEQYFVALDGLITSIVELRINSKDIYNNIKTNKKVIDRLIRVHPYVMDYLTINGRRGELYTAYKKLLNCYSKYVNIKIVADSDEQRVSELYYRILLTEFVVLCKNNTDIVTSLNLAKDFPFLLAGNDLKQSGFKSSDSVKGLKELGIITTPEKISFFELNKAQQEKWAVHLKNKKLKKHQLIISKKNTLIFRLYRIFNNADKEAIPKIFQEVKEPELQTSIAVHELLLYRNSINLCKKLHLHAKALASLSENQKKILIRILDLTSNNTIKQLMGSEVGDILGLSEKNIMRLKRAEAKNLLNFTFNKYRFPYRSVIDFKILIELLINDEPKLAGQVFNRMIEVFSTNTYYIDEVNKSLNQATVEDRVANLLSGIKCKNWREYIEFSLELLKGSRVQYYNVFSYLATIKPPFAFLDEKKITIEALREEIVFLSKNNSGIDSDLMDLLLISILRDGNLNHQAIITILDKLNTETKQKCHRVISVMRKICNIYIQSEFWVKHKRAYFPRVKKGLNSAYNHYPNRRVLANILKIHQSKKNHLSLISSLKNNVDEFTYQLPLAFKLVYDDLDSPLKLLDYCSISGQIMRDRRQGLRIAKNIVEVYLKNNPSGINYKIVQDNLREFVTFLLGNHDSESFVELLTAFLKNPIISKFPEVRLIALKHGLLKISEVKLNSLVQIDTEIIIDVIYYDKLLEERLLAYESQLKTKEEKVKLGLLMYEIADSAKEKHLLKYKLWQRELRLSKLTSEIKNTFSIYFIGNNHFTLLRSVNLDVSKNYRKLLESEFTNKKLDGLDKVKVLDIYQSGVKHYFALQLDKLKLKEVNSQIDAVVLYKDNNDSVSRYKEGISDGAFIVALDCIHSKDYKKLEKLLPILRKLVKLNVNNWYSESQTFNNDGQAYINEIITCLNIAHAICGKSDEYKKLMSSMNSEAEKKRISNIKNDIAHNFYTKQRPFLEVILQHEPDLVISDISKFGYLRSVLEDRMISLNVLLKLVKSVNVKAENLFKKNVHLAHIYEVMGDNKSALNYWDKALENGTKNLTSAADQYFIQYENIVATYHLLGTDAALLKIEKLKSVKADGNDDWQEEKNKIKKLKAQLQYLKKNSIND